MNPSVSVIVPVFNSGKALVPHIDSLLTQSLKNIEIIIVNDGSNDTTENVIENLVKKHTNIVSVHLDKNKGVHEARLAGLKKSSAPWVGFMDADDFARPNMYSTLLTAAKKSNADIVVCSCERVDEHRNFVSQKLKFKRSIKVENDIFAKFCRFEFGIGMLWNKLYKREIIEPFFDLHYIWRQDIDEDLLLNIGCFSKAERVYILDDILYDYVVNDKSITSTTNNSDAYIETYRAFALAMSLFSNMSDQYTIQIIEMYQMQFSKGEYYVYNLNDTDKYLLKEAVELIYSYNPLALALLPSCKPSISVGGRVAIKSLYHKGLAKMGLNFNAY
ncbi:glycosyltransferase [Psychrobacter sp. 4Bb]|uniref:glycosyltransferase n=1 Tax=Psychrobacter sp. 4Bb TaxID=888436 RepID=UPI000C79B6B1|nr:glycosyltransferase [Psychrobacter sp. 4Bb]PKH80796.1 glycosyltransferase family 2 protein [Psychrobacter sp. 4Bb]